MPSTGVEPLETQRQTRQIPPSMHGACKTCIPILRWSRMHLFQLMWTPACHLWLASVSCTRSDSILRCQLPRVYGSLLILHVFGSRSLFRRDPSLRWVILRFPCGEIICCYVVTVNLLDSNQASFQDIRQLPSVSTVEPKRSIVWM